MKDMNYEMGLLATCTKSTIVRHRLGASICDFKFVGKYSRILYTTAYSEFMRDRVTGEITDRCTHAHLNSNDIHIAELTPD